MIPLTRYRLVVFQVVIALVVVEVLLHFGYRVKMGSFLWSTAESQHFNVWNFTYPVSDARYVTAIPRFRDDAYTTTDRRWDVVIDDRGVRRCGDEQFNQYEKTIVVLGDSIPFGWAIQSSSSVPCVLEELLQTRKMERHVVNAALPSYSLDQAIQRYKIEIAQKYNVTEIILQTYDPVSSFVTLGSRWKTGANWTTLGTKWKMGSFERWFYQYSALYHVLKKYILTDLTKETLDLGDIQAKREFVDSITKSLDDLKRSSNGVKKIVLLSPTIPLKTWPSLSSQRRFAIELLNKTLKEYAANHRRFIYIDMLRELWKYPNVEELFIDDCCHLSEKGARIEAEIIAQSL